MLHLWEDYAIPHDSKAISPTPCGTSNAVVEWDGRDGHSHWSQIQSDHDRDLALRAAGYTVLRYTWPQITERPDQVAADIQRALLH